MPSPDIQTLYDFESNFEKAFSDLILAKLTTAGLTAPVYTSRDIREMEPLRVEIYLNVTGELQQKTTIGQSSPVEVPCAFTGNLMIVVGSERMNTAGRTAHGPTRGLVRYIMTGANELDGIALPYYQILLIQNLGSAPAAGEDKLDDVTVFTFELQWAINPDAWPATP